MALENGVFGLLLVKASQGFGSFSERYSPCCGRKMLIPSNEQQREKPSMKFAIAFILASFLTSSLFGVDNALLSTVKIPQQLVIEWDKYRSYLWYASRFQYAVATYDSTSGKLLVYYQAQLTESEDNQIDISGDNSFVWGDQATTWIPDSFFLIYKTGKVRISNRGLVLDIQGNVVEKLTDVDRDRMDRLGNYKPTSDK
jgi:hypothetical protein